MMSDYRCLVCGEADLHDDGMMQHLEAVHSLHPTRDFVESTALLLANGRGKSRGAGGRPRVRKNEGQLEEPAWAPLPRDEEIN